MNKKTAGATIKEARDGLRMTQRVLAKEVGVKASHIAYIENGQRKPSLALLRRLANVLDLNPRELLFLTHPDAKFLTDGVESTTEKRDSWQRFASNRALIKRHNITRAELKVLKQVTLLGNISNPRNFLFILNSIRLAGDQRD